MKVTSRTGLLASPRKKMHFVTKKPEVQLKAITGPAPYVLKPFAGVFNPYPTGCSLLCNHPTDDHARQLLRRAKDSWMTEGKSLLLAEEIAAIKAGLQQLQLKETHSPRPLPIDSVPEELFRRYTETDSRPLTPAPTIASAYTRASGSRRCVTPDPLPVSEVREKTLLVLDLRRSHSQETLSWHGSSQLLDPPLIRIQHVPTRTGTPEHFRTISHSPDSLRRRGERNLQAPMFGKVSKSAPAKPESKEQLSVVDKNEEEEVEADGEEDVIKRRGRRRRKRGRDSSRGPPAFQSSIDPETQVATIGLDSHNPSARPSLIPNSSIQEEIDTSEKLKALKHDSLDIDSFLDRETLKHLRRELNEEVVDREFDVNRRIALQEALRTITDSKGPSEAVLAMQKEINVSAMDVDLWLSLPRVFTRSSARFELPMDSRMLSVMTPMDYVNEYVVVTKPRKVLYNCIFNRHKYTHENPEEMPEELKRKILGKEIPKAMNDVMGGELTEEQHLKFRNLIGWSDDDIFNFKTFCGLSALCERLLAPDFCGQVPSREADPCNRLETADFEPLLRKLHGQIVDPRLVEILNGIKNL